ncbi:MAG: MFS transporter [Candidatus Marinimicrobia bacterium]|jgi:OPA family sugar phosphate sensor protein UhpC-like MFS transporter|nr:MFS transporter [Candidatus Neomarinimicrobiota bacterium]MBT4178209.1 MFS transporter [Candidatus Neomarinimicrobiota bacterium]MBT5356323.1 MFS transporter [Candidatus Neomarinimicrobiota bacterium]MBT6000830.1 MFS transporter [Candidatus Neomarinimicrobiota bacterium]
MKNLFLWWKTGQDKPVLTDESKIKKIFNRKRNSVLWSVVFGYGIFYIGRLTISVAKKPMMDAGILDATELGIIGSLLFYTYAFGKLTNGFLADRANIAKFMSTGLGISAIMNLFFGFTTAFWGFAVLWAINGWFQSMGSAPAVVSVTQWFSSKERGTYYGIWAASHNIGEGLTFIGTATVISIWGWQAGFIVPGVICLIVAIILFFTLQDRPETYGLPNVLAFKNETSEKPKTKKSIKDFQLDVLKSPVVIKVGLSATFLYIVRYAIHSWGPLYLQEAKGLGMIEAGTVMGVATMFGLGGAIFSGWFSDRFFHSKRSHPALIMALIQIVSLFLIYSLPSNSQWMSTAAFGLFEFTLGTLVVYIGGLWAVDLLPIKAAGSVKGIIGIFSYIGAATQDWISGLLIDGGKTTLNGVDSYNFDYAFTFWIGAAIIATLVPLTLWKEKEQN